MKQETSVTTIPINVSKEGRVIGRELHTFLQVETPFHKWVARRIEEFGFVENSDYWIMDKFVQNSPVGRPTAEYAFSLDMAKELAMVERTDQGKKARQYFIEVERRFHKVGTALTSLNRGEQLAMQAKLLYEAMQFSLEQEQRMAVVETKVEQLEEAASPSKIKELVASSLKEGKVNVFPRDCMKVDRIVKEYFPGISKQKVSTWLQHIEHPTSIYKSLGEDNVVFLRQVYRKEGLKQAAERLEDESEDKKLTPVNRIMFHNVLGEYRVKLSKAVHT